MVRFEFTLSSKDAAWVFTALSKFEFLGEGTEINNEAGSHISTDLSGISDHVNILMYTLEGHSCYRFILDNTTAILHRIENWNGVLSSGRFPLIDQSTMPEWVVTSHVFEPTDDPLKVQTFEYAQKNKDGELVFTLFFSIHGVLELK